MDKGSTLAVAAAEVGVSDGCIRRAIKHGLIVRKVTKPDKTKDRVKLKGPARRSQEDTHCNAGIATKREEERLLARKGNLTEALPEFSSNEGVHYAGVLLALPFLAGLSYLDTGKKVYGSLKKAYYGLQSILLTLAFMALLRMKNPEQLKNGNPGDFGIILGLDRCPEVKTLRRKLNELGLRNKSGQVHGNPEPRMGRSRQGYLGVFLHRWTREALSWQEAYPAQNPCGKTAPLHGCHHRFLGKWHQL